MKIKKIIKGKDIDKEKIAPCYTEFHKCMFRNVPSIAIGINGEVLIVSPEVLHHERI